MPNTEQNQLEKIVEESMITINNDESALRLTKKRFKSDR